MRMRTTGMLLVMALLTTSGTLPLAMAAESTTNGIYKLCINGDGVFTVATGSSHSHSNKNVFHGGKDCAPYTTSLTVRSYTSGKYYVTAGGSNAATRLDTFPHSVALFNPHGFTTTWTVAGADAGTDRLTIRQETVIEGSNQLNSMVRVTTTVTNNASTAVAIGIRYQWDWKIATSDRSKIKRHEPTDSSFTDNFFQEVPPTHKYYEMVKHFSAFGGPFGLHVFGTTNGPTGMVPIPPTAWNYSKWETAFGTPWTFSVTGQNEDSAVCYFWGDQLSNAINVPPGQSYSVTEYITGDEASLSCPPCVPCTGVIPTPFIPNVFAPNSSVPANRQWRVRNMSQVYRYRLEVRDRWGNVAFSDARDFQACTVGADSVPWDGGSYNTAVFAYALSLWNCNGRSTFSGNVTLLR